MPQARSIAREETHAAAVHVSHSAIIIHGVERLPTHTTQPVTMLERVNVEGVRDIEQEPDQMLLRQPVPHIRRRQNT